MFDPYFIEKIIPGLIVLKEGGLEPYQMEGTIDGYPFYYRERGIISSLGINPPGEGVPYTETDSKWFIRESFTQTP